MTPDARNRLPDDETLRRLVAEGRASGEPVDVEAVLERLRAKYAAMAAAKGVPPRPESAA